MKKRVKSESPLYGQLRLVYAGGLAESGKLLLDEYAASLTGWRDLFQVLGELYLHSVPELKAVPGTDLLRIQIVAEETGSYEAMLAFIVGAAANSIIGNRADDALKWSFRKMLEWYQAAVSSHVRTKSRTTNIEEIVAALENMTRAQGVTLESEEIVSNDELLLIPLPHPEETEIYSEPLSKARALAERIDHSLRSATQPLDRSCELISVVSARKHAIIEMGSAERAVILAPLTLPAPKAGWKRAKIIFERINRKTGRALFNFENEVRPEHGAHYSRIVDPSVHDPENVFTQAFNDDEPLEVWVRQVGADKGRLNLQWEISANPPEQMLLFNE